MLPMAPYEPIACWWQQGWLPAMQRRDGSLPKAQWNSWRFPGTLFASMTSVASVSLVAGDVLRAGRRRFVRFTG